ncbi:hypothetical protein ACFL9U_04705 [Thermodesulfobacteriota bacterium]
MTTTAPLTRERETLPTSSTDQRLIDSAVICINNMVAETICRGSIEIGEYLLIHFFNNDIELATSKNAHKSLSFNALCNHPDIAASQSTLTRMVRVAAQERFFLSKRIDINRLSYSHRLELIKLENGDVKIELAWQCIRSSLSHRQLIPLVKQAREESITTSITSATLARKHISELEHLLDGSAAPAFLNDVNELKSIPQDTREKMRDVAVQLLNQIPLISRSYESLVRNLDRIKIELEENI